MLNGAIIQELRQILKADYGKEVSKAEASEIVHTLVGYFDLLAKIYHQEKVKNNYGDNKPKDNRRI